MTVANFKWDDVNRSISWMYNGLHLIKRYDHAYFASLNMENQYVVVEAGKNYAQDQLYFLSFDGREIFKVDKANDTVSWLLQNHLIEVHCKHIINAQIYLHEGIVVTITLENQLEKVLKVYKMNGSLLFVNHPPAGFDFSYLSTFNKQPSVVCNGDKNNTDAFNRTTWNFIIDTTTGEMTKANLAY